MIERIDDEQQRLEVIDLEALVDHPFDLERVALHVGPVDGVGDLAIAGQQAAAVRLQVVAILLAAHQAELDAEPEEARHRLDVAGEPAQLLVLVADGAGLLRCHGGRLAEPDQRAGKGRVGVHGDVAGDVVKDVGLGQVLQRLAVAHGDGGGELAPAQTIEEDVRRHVPADPARLEPGQRPHEPVHILEARHPVVVQTQQLHAGLEALVGIALPARLHAREQPLPGGVVLRRVQLVRLVDVDVAVLARLFNERRLGRRQSAARGQGAHP